MLAWGACHDLHDGLGEGFNSMGCIQVATRIAFRANRGAHARISCESHRLSSEPAMGFCHRCHTLLCGSLVVFLAHLILDELVLRSSARAHRSSCSSRRQPGGSFEGGACLGGAETQKPNDLARRDLSWSRSWSAFGYRSFETKLPCREPAVSRKC